VRVAGYGELGRVRLSSSHPSLRAICREASRELSSQAGPGAAGLGTLPSLDVVVAPGKGPSGFVRVNGCGARLPPLMVFNPRLQQHQ
jgi:hypothetical protein